VVADVVVVGGGPGGYASAIHCAQLGARVTLVEADKVGGTCLNRGCIPTKAMFEAARVLRDATRAADFGVHLEGVAFDFARMAARRDRVVAGLVAGLGQLLKGNGVTVVRGRGRLAGPNAVEVTGPDAGRLQGDAVILAPGSVTARVPIPGIDLPGVVDSDGLLQLTEQPKSLCIIGGGVIGCEFASIFAAYGTEVTVVELMPQLLPPADAEIARRLAGAFRRAKIGVLTGARVVGIREAGGLRRVDVEVDGGRQEVAAEVVLVAVGRRPNTADLGLETVGIRPGPGGAIPVDARLRTAVPSVLAVGDAIGAPMLAHAGFAQALVAAEVLAGHRAEWGSQLVPSPVFCHPEVAWVGLTEAQARSALGSVEPQVGRFPFSALGRAQIAGETEGFVKLIAEPGSGRVLGVHLIGPQATELVAEASVLVQCGLVAEDVEGSVHPHPTLSEALAEAAAMVLGRPLDALVRR
jgi:dihydrolipoamide dehydrogenase